MNAPCLYSEFQNWSWKSIGAYLEWFELVEHEGIHKSHWPQIIDSDFSI